MASIFRSPEAKERLVQWHHRFRERIGRPTESRRIETRFGETHVLSCGPADAPPVVMLHGALASSAHVMGEVASLADRFRLIGLDVIGQSPMSAEVRPEVKGTTYGQWAVDCLDALELDRVNLIGVSWGGFIALRTAALAPESILRLSLVVPAAIVNGHGLDPVVKQAVPLMMYRAFPSPARLEKFLRYQLSTPDDPDWKPYMGDALLDFRLDFRPPGLVREGELDALDAPVQVFGAELDLSFPGERLLERSQKIFRNLVQAELLAGSRHSPATDPDSRLLLAGKIGAFFSNTSEGVPAASA